MKITKKLATQTIILVACSFGATFSSFAAETNQDKVAVNLNNAIELAPITVTAQKQVQRVDDVPTSISVIDQNDLNQAHATSLDEVQQLVTDFSVIQNGLTKSISIRGIGGGGRNIGFDTRAGVYIDGVYMGQAPALESPIFDIEQIEILRGPQGYMFGRNTDAGAVNITTVAASDTFQGFYKTGFGNYNSTENQLSVTGPITDQLLGKLSIASQTRDGYVTNLLNGDDIKDLNRFSGRTQLRYLATDKLSFDLSADYANIHHTDFLPQATTGLFDTPLNTQSQRSLVNVNNQPTVKTEVFGTSLKANYALDSGNTITSITAYRRTNNFAVNDTDYSAVDLIHTNFADHYQQVSQELRFASAFDQSLRYVLGLYVEHEKSNTNRRAIFGNDVTTLVKLPTLANPVPFNAAFGIQAGAVVPVIGQINTDTVAVFGSADYDITKQMTLNLGGRYSDESKKLTFDTDGTQSGAIGIATLSNYHDERSDQFFSPMLGLTYALADHLKAYAKYSRGFKSGGWNVDFLSTAQVNNGFSYDKETVNSYETGLKGESDNHKVQYDIALFKNMYNNFQVFQFVDLGAGQTILQLKNAAKVESLGIETSMRALLSPHWDLSGGLAVLDAHYVDFPNGGANGQNAAGNSLPDAPRLSGVIATDYHFNWASIPGRFNLHLEDSFQGRTRSGFSSDSSISKLDSRSLVNIKASYLSDNQHWEFAVWARNLLDESYAKAKGRDFFGNQVSFFGDPRFYGVTGQYNF